VSAEHGTSARYYRGCRCPDCTEAKRLRVEQNRLKARARGFTGLQHGGRSAYDCGCRCQLCVAFRSARARTEPWRGKSRATVTGICSVCRRRYGQLSDGLIVTHGPLAQRCFGSGRAPLQPVRQVAA
jgi:hypothetical protein